MDKAKQAQEARSRRYKIGIKPGGNVTIPGEHRERWPGIEDEDYLDPVNYRYPCPNAEQTRVAARYWAQEDNRRQYTEGEQEIITRRLEEKKKKFKIGEYAQENTYAVILTSDLAAHPPEWVQLLPFGYVKSTEGDFTVDEESLREIVNRFRERGNDIVIDYEHQTLGDVVAPAAGWIKELEGRGQAGLWARVEWNERARQYIANKEYRYLSPVVLVRRADGKAAAIHSVGLTNAPAIDGMPALVNKNKEAEEMNLAAIAKKLGLPENATEEQVLAALDGLKARSDLVAHKEILTLLDLKEDARLEEVKGAVIALKNPSGYVSIQQFNELKQKLEIKERDELVAQALKSGKVAPAQKEWAEAYALKDPDGFKAFLEKAPVVVPVQEIVGGKSDPAKQARLEETQALVNKMLGITDEIFKKYGGESE
ncbi:MAG: phage protease [Bacillota bacterium]